MLFFTTMITLSNRLLILKLLWLILCYLRPTTILLLCLLPWIVRHRNIVAIVKTVWIVMRLLISCCVVNIIGRLLQTLPVNYLWLSWNSFGIRVLTIRADVHIGVIILLLQWWPSLFTDQRIVIFIFCIFFEKCLWSWGLWLVVVGANVAAYIFALVEIAIYVILHCFLS